ncbi:MAG: hypothetical protein GY906_30785 [bacterium]|nr:hypothetical protein [bacterium]
MFRGTELRKCLNPNGAGRAKLRRIVQVGNTIGFVLACALAFLQGLTTSDLAWGLLISSMVGGSLALMIPLWALLLFPKLEEALFPDQADLTTYSGCERLAMCMLLATVFIGPYLFFMLIFTGFLVEHRPVEGMPSKDGFWISHALWALFAYLPLVVVITTTKVFESTVRIWKGDGSAFLRPWALIVKMFVLVFLSNFGDGWWMIITLVALIYLPEDTLLYWIGRERYREFSE